MSKILIIHHLEEMWDSGYKKFGNTNFFNLEYKFFEFLQENNFDKVILTKFELPTYNYFGKINRSQQFINDYCNIWSFITECHEYGYGWTKDSLIKSGAEFCDGGNHSEAVLIEDWMKQLSNDEVFISGAFLNECLEDIEIAMKYLNINYKLVIELCV